MQNEMNITAGRRAIVVYAALLLVSLLWLAVIFAAPMLAADGRVLSAMAIYRGLAGICHQIPARSFHLRGFPLAVCSRCTGIYVGFTLGLMLYPFAWSPRHRAMPHRRWLILAALPALIDFGGGYIGLFENAFFSRAATGGLLGAAFSVYILVGMISAVDEWAAMKSARGGMAHLPSE